MHEMSLAEGIIQLVEETARREAARTVRRVVLEIGQLAAVDGEALRFCFDAVAAGGVARGATLEMIAVPGAGRCADCGRTVPLPERLAGCPACGGYRVTPTAGTALRVREIEIE